MKFLILFVVLLIHYRFPLPERSTLSRTFAWWTRLFQPNPLFLRLPRHLRYVLVVLVPTALLTAAFVYLDRLLWGLLTFVLEILLLFYVLAHSGIERHLQDYKDDLVRGDTQAAYRCAEQYLALPEVEVSEDVAGLNEQVIRALLHRWFEYFFLMVFWYMIADVAGVLLAWFSVQYARASDCDDKAWRYLHWLEWIPVRLLGLTYGLAGNFIRALPVWRSYLWQRDAVSGDVLFDVASSALSSSGEERKWHSISDGTEEAVKELQEWQNLHLRSMSVWMVLIAAATIGGVLL